MQRTINLAWHQKKQAFGQGVDAGAHRLAHGTHGELRLPAHAAVGSPGDEGRRLRASEPRQGEGRPAFQITPKHERETEEPVDTRDLRRLLVEDSRQDDAPAFVGVRGDFGRELLQGLRQNVGEDEIVFPGEQRMTKAWRRGEEDLRLLIRPAVVARDLDGDGIDVAGDGTRLRPQLLGGDRENAGSGARDRGRGGANGRSILPCARRARGRCRTKRGGGGPFCASTRRSVARGAKNPKWLPPSRTTSEPPPPRLGRRRGGSTATRSSANKHPCVEAWCPVPKARPASIVRTRRRAEILGQRQMRLAEIEPQGTDRRQRRLAHRDPVFFRERRQRQTFYPFLERSRREKRRERRRPAPRRKSPRRATARSCPSAARSPIAGAGAPKPSSAAARSCASSSGTSIVSW